MDFDLLLNSKLDYLLVLLFLVLVDLVYMRMARNFDLIDIPNQRSSHKLLIVRGGGFVIPLAIMLYAILTQQLDKFIMGTLIIASVSFIDDLKSLPNRWRVAAQVVGVILLLIEANGFSYTPLVTILLLIVILGTINAVNFMDGINGITAMFGVVTTVALIFLNSTIDFIDQRLLIYTFIGLLVFAIFNFRKTARCFAGDVGSVSLGYILVYFTLLYFLKTGDISIIVLWTVYGVDSVLTIINRLLKRENIFKAHRSHLYQYYANELGRSHLLVAVCYGVIQGVINVIFIFNLKLQFLSPLVFTILVLSSTGVAYIFIRIRVLRKLRVIQNVDVG